MNIRDEFDKLVCETTDYVISETPAIIIENLNKWKWGSYGWTSPVTLFIPFKCLCERKSAFSHSHFKTTNSRKEA